MALSSASARVRSAWVWAIQPVTTAGSAPASRAAAGDDILARLLRVPVYDLLSLFRVLVLVLPLLTGAHAFFIARATSVGDDPA